MPVPAAELLLHELFPCSTWLAEEECHAIHVYAADAPVGIDRNLAYGTIEIAHAITSCCLALCYGWDIKASYCFVFE